MYTYKINYFDQDEDSFRDARVAIESQLHELGELQEIHIVSGIFQATVQTNMSEEEFRGELFELSPNGELDVNVIKKPTSDKAEKAEESVSTS